MPYLDALVAAYRAALDTPSNHHPGKEWRSLPTGCCAEARGRALAAIAIALARELAFTKSPS